jgi:fumarate reductase flavoprotein subunit
MTTVGSLFTDRFFRVINDEQDPIDGLYAIGLEGSMMWFNIYTIDISGGSCANSVHSGRVAARHAVSRL